VGHDSLKEFTQTVHDMSISHFQLIFISFKDNLQKQLIAYISKQFDFYFIFYRKNSLYTISYMISVYGINVKFNYLLELSLSSAKVT